MKKLLVVVLSVFFALPFAFPAVFAAEASSGRVLVSAGVNAEVLAFERVGNDYLLVYSDGNTGKLVNSAGHTAATDYPAIWASVHGNAITLIETTPLGKDYLAVDKITAQDLVGKEMIDLFELESPYSTLLFAESDSFYHWFAVFSTDMQKVLLCSNGSVEPITAEGEIQGIDVLGDQLYVFLRDYIYVYPLSETGISTTAWFEIPYGHAPHHMLDESHYIAESGLVFELGASEPLFDTKISAINLDTAFCAGGMVYWLSDTKEVSRSRMDGTELATCTLSGKVVALADGAALFHENGDFLLAKFGEFTLSATPTPEPTEAPEPSAEPSASPSADPSNRPTATPRVTATPKPTATPTPVPTPAPWRSQVKLEAPYIFVPHGMSVKELKDAFLPEIPTVTNNGSSATGNVRTGMGFVLGDEVLTVIVPGDLNGTGTVNSNDIKEILRYLTFETDLDPLGLTAGDVNRDGFVDSTDLVQIVQIIG